MLKSFFGLLTLLVVCWSCTPPPVQYARYEINEGAMLASEVEAAPSTYQKKVYVNEDYLPDTLHPEYTPPRRLLLNFHYMNTSDTFFRQYEGEAGIKYLKNLVYTANQDLKKNRKSQLQPPGMNLPVYTVNMKMYIANKPGTKEPAIYRHYDDDLYYFTFKGKTRNLGSRAVVNKYGVDLDNVLNIFVMPPHRDSMTTKDFSPNEIRGVSLGNSLKISGFYPEVKQHWVHRGNLNHEVGHALGLNHAWRSDGCDDTPEHNNDCWSRKQSERCDTMTSNNLMDYSALQIAWTPCQIGRVHARLSDPNSRSRKWLRTSWCEPDPDQEILVNEQIHWKGGRDLRSTIRITDGASLLIDGRLHLAKGQKIIVEPGGKLELGPNARIHNDCNELWAGIELGKQGKLKGTLVVDSAASLENMLQ